MHPILTQQRRLALYLFLFLQAGWLLGELLASTAAGQTAAEHGPPRLQAILLAAPLLLVHAWSCLASWYLCRSLPLATTRPERLVVTQLAAGLAASGVLLAVGAFWARTIDGTSSFAGTAELFRQGRTLVLVFAFLLFSLAVAVHYLFIAAAASLTC